MAKGFNPAIADTVSSFLDEDDWNYFFDDERGHFKFDLSMSGNLNKINYVVTIGKTDYIVYAILPIAADKDNPEQMMKMSEYLHRCNYNLRNGNFEIDFSDGEVRFKSYVDCCDLPSAEAVGTSIRIPGLMVDRYAKGILQVIFNNMDPKEAVDMCEGTTSSHLADMIRKLQSRLDSLEDRRAEEHDDEDILDDDEMDEDEFEDSDE